MSVVAVSYSFKYVWSMFCKHIRAEMIVNRQTLSGGSVSYNIIECISYTSSSMEAVHGY